MIDKREKIVNDSISALDIKIIYKKHFFEVWLDGEREKPHNVNNQRS